MSKQKGYLRKSHSDTAKNIIRHKFNDLPYTYTNRRTFITAGVAAGVAAAFNAPIGGLLFAMEDLTSFWSKRISWQTFFCAGIAAITTDMLNTGFTAFSYQGSFGMLSLAVSSKLSIGPWWGHDVVCLLHWMHSSRLLDINSTRTIDIQSSKFGVH